MYNVNFKINNLKNTLIIFLIGILFPLILTHSNLNIYGSIHSALNNWDKEFLIIAIFKLVFLNTLRAFPTYVLMLILFESIEITFNGKKRPFEKNVIVLLVLPIMYVLTNLFYHLELSIGKTSILCVIWFFFYTKFDLKTIHTFEKYLILLFFITGVQWIDVSSYFSFLSVGEITKELNSVINFMDANFLVKMLCGAFFLFFTLISILLLYFFKCQDETLNSQQAQLENRYLKETQQLVHDLKTPLFSIGTLIEILKMKEEDPYSIGYLDRIEATLDKTNIMIGEILDINSKRVFHINDVVKFVFSFLSANKNINSVNCFNYLNSDSKIYANKILVSRAIINLITNSWEAHSKNINFTLKDYKKYILLKISDDGVGISNQYLSKLGIDGFSKKGSTGKGLHFVKKVIEDINGNVYFVTKEKGLDIYLIFKGGTN